MGSTIALIIILILLFIILSPKTELFNVNFYDSMLMKDMDYIKDRKGYTLDDYILYDHAIYGKGIDSPF